MSVSRYELERYEEVMRKENERRHGSSVHRKHSRAPNMLLVHEAEDVGVMGWSWSPSSGKLQLQVHDEKIDSDFKRADAVNQESGGLPCVDYVCSIANKPLQKKRNCVTGFIDKARECKSSVRENTLLEKCSKEEGKRVDSEFSASVENSLPSAEGEKADRLQLSLPRSLETCKGRLRRRRETIGIHTRSMTAAMRGARNSANIGKESIPFPKSGRRAGESFVPWKKPVVTHKEGGNQNTVQISPTGKGNSRGMRTSRGSSSRLSSPLSVPIIASAGENASNGNSVSASKQRGQFTTAVRGQDLRGHRSTGRGEDLPMLNGAVSERHVQRAGKELSTGVQSSSKIVSTHSSRAVHEEIVSRNRKRRFEVLQGVRDKDDQGSAETLARSGGTTSEQQGRTSCSAEKTYHVEPEDRQKYRKTPTIRDDEEALSEHDDEYAVDEGRNTERQLLSETHAVDFEEEDVNDIDVTESEDVGEEADVEEHALEQESEYDNDVRYLIYPTEAEKRKERRQERALIEKKGEIRKKEGLPRNFLLVDEITKKPYSVGVGDWRKELMLLSRDLDPAIGNINRQPEGTVAEIAQWIQKTWEYSSPIKFEFVKEVIARGVTLRRGELWRKIRNGEEKPSGISDRTWRTLERQLDNPASMRKSENCRRANASRVNFGRTGPSGEVGVRQRLRRTLRRSPDPEEVRIEMARDKGYGGRQYRDESNVNVMQGSGRPRRLTLDAPKRSASCGISEEDKSQDDRVVDSKDEDEPEGESYQVNVESRLQEGSRELVVAETVASMSAEDISKHPFVVMMMQRLEALESKKGPAEVEVQLKRSEQLPTEDDEDEGRVGEDDFRDCQDGGHGKQSGVTGSTPTVRRHSKRGRQG